MNGALYLAGMVVMGVWTGINLAQLEGWMELGIVTTLVLGMLALMIAYQNAPKPQKG
jgi:hypothetical protein